MYKYTHGICQVVRVEEIQKQKLLNIKYAMPEKQLSKVKPGFATDKTGLGCGAEAKYSELWPFHLLDAGGALSQ